MIIFEETSLSILPEDEILAPRRGNPSLGLTPFPAPCLVATTRLTKDPGWQPCAQGITNQKFDFNINHTFSIFNPIPQQPLNQTPPHDVAPQ
jgi:hypothetical protein